MNKIIEEEKKYFLDIYEEDACETGNLNYNFFKYGNDTYIFRFRQ